MVSSGEAADSGIGMLMNLRKVWSMKVSSYILHSLLSQCANHPLLIRDHYDTSKLEVMARLLKTRDSGHKQAIESYIVEDLKIMSDFEINKTCETYRVWYPDCQTARGWVLCFSASSICVSAIISSATRGSSECWTTSSRTCRTTGIESWSSLSSRWWWTWWRNIWKFEDTGSHLSSSPTRFQDGTESGTSVLMGKRRSRRGSSWLISSTRRRTFLSSYCPPEQAASASTWLPPTPSSSTTSTSIPTTTSRRRTGVTGWARPKRLKLWGKRTGDLGGQEVTFN